MLLKATINDKWPFHLLYSAFTFLFPVNLGERNQLFSIVYYQQAKVIFKITLSVLMLIHISNKTKKKKKKTVEEEEQKQ